MSDETKLTAPHEAEVRKTPREVAEELARILNNASARRGLARRIQRALREYAAARLREAQRSISGPGYLGGYTGPEQAKELEAFQHGLATAAECIQRLAAREDGHDAALTPPTPKETE